MYVAIVSFFLLLSATVYGRDSATQYMEDQNHGKFESQDGSKCVWLELRKGDRGNVLVVACHCKNDQGNGQSYDCQYNGPFEECDIYRDYPREFYNSLIQELGK